MEISAVRGPIVADTTPTYKINQDALRLFNAQRSGKGKEPLTEEQVLARINGGEPGMFIEEFSNVYGDYEPSEIDPTAGPFTHKDLKTTISSSGWIYIIALDGKLKFALDYDPQSFKKGIGHVDLADGKNILGAGDIIIQDFCSIIWLDNGSGHYMPGGESPYNVALKTFSRKGWKDITPVWHEVGPNKFCPNPACKTVHGEWLTRYQKLQLARNISAKVDRQT